MSHVLSAALQDYLEAIQQIEEEKRVARPRDISQAVGVHKSTVTAALRNLAERGLINYAPYEAVTLTDEGRKRACRIAMRHRVVADFLTKVLNVEDEAADRNAASIQHAAEEEVLEKIVCFLVFAGRHAAQDGWLARFRRFSELPRNECGCEEWMRRYTESVENNEL
jgi:DtxR family Mn-dependent transcriptional regulator